MPDCRLCPRQCGADRAVSAGVCHMGSAVRVARAAPHYGEEPCISGERGSGAVFFAGCPLGCVYCQNYALSRGRIGETVSVERLAAIFAGLEAKGVHNLNLVTGTQFTPEIREALAIAKPKIPVVWNTSGYETVEALHAIAPVADVFLADFKYADSNLARKLSHATDYPAGALDALDVMIEIAGEPCFDEYHGQLRMTRGVVVRHLLLPGHVAESCAAVELLHKRYGDNVLLSLMNQYTPVLDASSVAARKYPELLRAPSSEEYEQLLDLADSLGIEDYFWQEGGAIDESFIPAFEFTGV